MSKKERDLPREIARLYVNDHLSVISICRRKKMKASDIRSILRSEGIPIKEVKRPYGNGKKPKTYADYCKEAYGKTPEQYLRSQW